MGIKYEAVFGPQELFDGVPEYIEVIRFNDYSRDYLWSDLDKIKHLTFRDLKAIPIVAMRRIISTPTWSVADQRDGKLPEVGCRIYVPIMFEEQTVIYSSEKVIVSISDNGGAVTRTEVSSIDRIKPIESQEEKAERLRAEWYTKARKIYRNSNSDFKAVYDALLSGDLPVPVKGE